METQASPPPPKPISPFARALRNTGYLLGGSGVSAVLGFLTTIFAARQLGLESFGILLLIHSFTGALAAGTRLQSWQPMLQFGTSLYGAQEQTRFQTLLRHCLLLDAAGALAAVVISFPIVILYSHWLGLGGYEKTTALYVTCALFMNTGATMGVMRLADRYKMAAIADSFGAFIRFVGAALGLLLHWHLQWFMVVWYLSIVGAFCADGVLLWWLTKLIPSLHGFRLTGVAWRSSEPGFWKLLLPTSADQALIGLASRVDILIVGALLGGVDTALYRVAAQIGEALAQPVGLLTPALYPEFVRLREQASGQTLRSLVWRLFRWLSLFSALVLLAIYVVGPAILDLMLGKHVPHTREFLLWMTMASVIDLWNVPIEPLLVSMGNAKTLFHSRLWVLLLCLPLQYGLTLFSGVNGAAIAGFIRKGAIFMTRFIVFTRMS